MADEHAAAIEGGAHDETAPGPRMDSVIASGSDGHGGSVHPPLTVTLNSRRLTTERLRQLGAALDVPATASSEDLRAMIEGKLVETGRDPLRTQVVMQTVERGDHMTLQDETEPFLEVEPPTVEDPPPNSLPESSEETATPDVAMVRALRIEVESQDRVGGSED